ncbi:putative primosomal protein N' [Catellatospora methionotrophica]|uniref:Probable replication restart protein PriA n=1 Tax=Catellatospora methionotrophica TaxID=121620 RepID=A0A8J3PI50_9ACTN|nr:putative primosomal protein N' [Catellatospora methionotrophica]
MTVRPRRDREPAERLPVARVCVDVPLPHLDRTFDYRVPSDLDVKAWPGTRVKVRFSGQLVDGWLLDRVEDTAHEGRLSWLEKVVSPEPVLDPQVLRAAREVADRYAGSLADVLRLAVPPRQAKVEAEPALPVPQGRVAEPPHEGWQRYPAGEAFLRALGEGRAPRAVWSALPGEQWPDRIAEAVAATLHAGRGAVVVVADARDLDRLDTALLALLGPDRHVALSAALGPTERYRRFLRARRGQVAAVVGTRSAALAPVADLGLVAIWDDGDDLHAEPRSPYPHTRQVLLTRAQQQDAAVLVGGFARTAEAQLLLSTGWAKEIAANRDQLRRYAPVVLPADDNQLARDPAAASARLPSAAWLAARDALAAGAPVLVQVPRRGYVPAVSCQECRERARCAHCAGPLALGSAAGVATCRWCARPAAGWACPACGGRRLRAAVTGVRRTAEELGRALPGVPVRTSGRDAVLATVPAEAALVLATPGAEPVAEGGYGAVLLLDAWALLTRADLRATEEAARRWFNAAALARPAGRGGKVVVVADSGLATVQALVRWDPAWLAERELRERRELGFPPAARLASLTGQAAAVDELLNLIALPEGVQVLGPLPVGEDEERMLLRTGRAGGLALAKALHDAAGVRSLRKAPHPVRIQLDPHEL